MLVLGIDTSTKVGAIGLYDNVEGKIGDFNFKVELNHSDTLLKGIDTLLQFCNKKSSDIALISVGEGPGSFTGIRVGMGIAKGMSYSLNIPIVGINSLLAPAYLELSKEKRVVSIMDARNNRVFFSEFQKIDNKIDEIECTTIEIKDFINKYIDQSIIIAGPGLEKYRENLEPYFKCQNKSIVNISGVIIAELGLKFDKSNAFDIEPKYIVKSQAEKNNKLNVRSSRLRASIKKRGI